MTDPLRDYATKMQDIKASDELIDRVLMQAEREQHATAGRAPTAKPTRRVAPRRRAHLVPKIAAAAACVAALTVGIAFASGSVNLPGTLFSGDQLSDTPNSFALAYAADNPDGEQGAPVILRDNFGWGGSSGAYYDPDTGQFTAWDDWAGYKYGFNVACTGSNIQSVSYQIEGEHTYFEIIDNEKVSRPSTQEEIDSGDTSAFTYTKNVSFAYNNQDSITDDRIVSIYLGYPVPDDVKAVFAKLQSGDQDHHLFYEYSTGLDIAAAQTLAQAKLILTATFTDGSTETKTYVISPIEGFEQQIADYWEASYQWQEQRRQEDQSQPPTTNAPEKPAIYTITEVA